MSDVLSGWTPGVGGLSGSRGFTAPLPAVGGKPDGRKGIDQHAAREEGRGLALTATQRQAHGFPEPHPADPDEFANPVIALRLSRCHEA